MDKGPLKASISCIITTTWAPSIHAALARIWRRAAVLRRLIDDSQMRTGNAIGQWVPARFTLRPQCPRVRAACESESETEPTTSILVCG